ncbi:winged helix-turn-helix transcriptional regulator [Streptacidiphilus sp. N1-3]|uniref:Winged helix-turn-helix transcriptional regulator n=1 Tax=Streptacidiphilus alkalitolerans TaxID=3342712 RepID=A0ABV6WUQ8_9ACTN
MGTEPGPLEAEEHGAMCTGAGSAFARAFGLLGKRWTGLIVTALMSGPIRFADFRRVVPGISERMLSERLTELVAADMVVREVEPGPPLRVSYDLTETGAALRPALVELGRWAEECLPKDQGDCGSKS